MSFVDKVTVDTRYTRSVNLERDRGSASITRGYLPTIGSLRILRQVSLSMKPGNQPRAWSLIGPYGAGKSSFALFLHELLGQQQQEARSAALNRLKEADGELSVHFQEQRNWCRVVLTGRTEPLADSLLGALHKAAVAHWRDKNGRKPAVIKALSDEHQRKQTSESRVLQLFDEFNAALKKTGSSLLLIIDELGRFLEHETKQDTGGLHLLQELAERTFSGERNRFLLFVLLHQGIELYARALGERSRNEWAKVQGRFQTVSFIESTEQMLRIVAAAFSNDFTASERVLIERRSREIASKLLKSGVIPAGLEQGAAKEIFKSCYPLHPVSLLLLPSLCQKLAQNERTLFGYLGSREPDGFQDSLERLASIDQWVTPAHIYDYFVQNQPVSTGDPLASKRWAEVVTAVQRAESEFGTLEHRARKRNAEDALLLAKTIGLLNLAVGGEGLRASREVLESLFDDKESFKQAIEQLTGKSIVQFRRFSGDFRVWQGTDIDIEQRSQLESERLGDFDVAAALNRNSPLGPIVARRHSIQTGNFRFLETLFVDSSSIRRLKDESDARILFFLSRGRDDKEVFHEARCSVAQNSIWAYCEVGDSLKEVTREVLSLESMQSNVQELASDPIASREVRERLAAARIAQKERLTSLIHRPEDIEWYWRDSRVIVPNRSAFQGLISHMIDDLYCQAPYIRNELINRDKLSSQAAAARNKLLRAMLSSANQAALGIEKYPPEKAIYLSIFLKGGLHARNGSTWEFVEPKEPDELRMCPVWNRLDELFERSEENRVTAQSLMDELAKAPFGVKRGVSPVIVLHYYLVRRSEIASYEDRRYLPSLSYEHIERLLRRPDQFSFQRIRIQGIRLSLLREYSLALFGEPHDEGTLLGIARPLTRFVLDLDEFAQKTRRLSPTAMAVREACLLAKSPQKLLLGALPRACGYELDAELEGFSEKLTGALRELNQASSELRDSMRRAFCICFGIDEETEESELRVLLRGRCHGLDEYTVDVKGLKGFIRRVCDGDSSSKEWFGGLLLFLSQKPVQKWSDQDHDMAEYRLAELCRRLLDLEKLRLHHESVKSSDSDFEIILIKTLRKNDQEIDEIVAIGSRVKEAITEPQQQIEEILDSVDDHELRLALIAKVAHEHLAKYREGNRRVVEQPSKGGVRNVG